MTSDQSKEKCKRNRDNWKAEALRLRSVFELIRDNGGKDEEICCTGSWCAEQARRALEQTALAGKERGK